MTPDRCLVVSHEMHVAVMLAMLANPVLVGLQPRRVP